MKGRRFTINTQVIYARLESYFEVRGPQGVIGARLDFEDFLGFERNKYVPSFDFQYAFTRRSSAYAEYYSIFRNSNFDVLEGFDFGDITIPPNAGKASMFYNTQIWSLGYMYSFINSRTANLSFFFNLFILGVESGIDIEQQNITKRLFFTAPLPSFGYKFNYEIVPKVRFGGSHSFFFLDLENFTGGINNLKLNLDYRALKWLSAGLVYNVFHLDINSMANTLQGTVVYKYKGPGIMLQFIF